MAFFRSEPMTSWYLLIHLDAAFESMVALGTIGMVHIKGEDKQTPNMLFTNEVQRCIDLGNIIEYFETNLDDFGIDYIYYPNVDTEYEPKDGELVAIEAKVLKFKRELTAANRTRSELATRQLYLKEWLFVIDKVHAFLESDEEDLRYTDSIISNLMRDDTEGEVNESVMKHKIHYMAGTINTDRVLAFKTIIQRFFGNNILVQNSEIPILLPNPIDVSQTNWKSVIIIISLTSWMRAKILRLCSAYNVTIFNVPNASHERLYKITGIESEIEYINVILEENERYNINLLELLRIELHIWKVNIKKSLMIYMQLNQMTHLDYSSNKNGYLQTVCWIPDNEINRLRHALHGKTHTDIQFGPILLKRTPHHSEPPPTFFRTNKVTSGFQALVDAYGLASYGEINPAPYAIVTFPFLFGVMFGDIGHGFILTLFSAYLIKQEKTYFSKKGASKKENEVWDILFGGRYIILLMGLFSMYCGFLYNECFSTVFNIFGSAWTAHFNITSLHSLDDHAFSLNPENENHYRGYPYAFGCDPIWYIATDESIIFNNSLKMKLAIIFGFSQMIFGLILAASNTIFFRRTSELVLVVMPTIIFLVCLFGYLVFLIYFKWLTFGGQKKNPYNSACAPSILITFIDMLLFKQSTYLPKGCNEYMYSGQEFVEVVLVVFALSAIPILLAGKPIYLMRQRKRVSVVENVEERDQVARNTLTQLRGSLKYNIEYEAEHPPIVSTIKLDNASDVIEFDMTEVWIHSGIHTIECVLGSLSHTASYLRLWALSLAHQQLAEVLWEMVFSKGLTYKASEFRFLLTYVTFMAFGVLTISIMVAMEGLSAFLHALRLHWVEFQSKFYSGEGQPFTPFRFSESTI